MKHDVVHTCQVGDRYLFLRVRCGAKVPDIPGEPDRPLTIGDGPACPECVRFLGNVRDGAVHALQRLTIGGRDAS